MADSEGCEPGIGQHDFSLVAHRVLPVPWRHQRCPEVLWRCLRFACLSTIIGAIQNDDHHFTTDALIVAGIHVADRFARPANTWRDEAAAGGLQP